MQVGIIEVCEANHYTAVYALAKTYSINPANEVTIFTLKHIAHLFDFEINNVKLVIKSDLQTIAEFLSSIATLNLGRVHINTISSFYKEFSEITWTGSVYFTIHNTELWFDRRISKKVRLLLFELSELLKGRDILKWHIPFILFFKDFKRQYFRSRFIENLLKADYKVIVFSHSQRQYLNQYVPLERILVFPFCLNGSLADLSANNAKIRLSIPGSVSNRRRDYTSLIKMFHQNMATFRDKVTLDILGYIPLSDRYLVNEIEELKEMGMDIIYSLQFIDPLEFDDRLSKSSLILGNLRTQLNPFQKYGETKETGIIFNVIKSGKPAILPISYPVDENLQEACLFFDGYNDLSKILIELIDNPHKLILLQNKSAELTKYYSAENLYTLLVG